MYALQKITCVVYIYTHTHPYENMNMKTWFFVFNQHPIYQRMYIVIWKSPHFPQNNKHTIAYKYGSKKKTYILNIPCGIKYKIHAPYQNIIQFFFLSLCVIYLYFFPEQHKLGMCAYIRTFTNLYILLLKLFFCEIISTENPIRKTKVRSLYVCIYVYVYERPFQITLTSNFNWKHIQLKKKTVNIFTWIPKFPE